VNPWDDDRLPWICGVCIAADLLRQYREIWSGWKDETSQSIASTAEFRDIINRNAQISREAEAFRSANSHSVNLPDMIPAGDKLREAWRQPMTPEAMVKMQKLLAFWGPIGITALGAPRLGLAIGVVGGNYDDQKEIFDKRGAAIDAGVGIAFSFFDFPLVIGDLIEVFISRGIRRVIDSFSAECELGE